MLDSDVGKLQERPKCAVYARVSTDKQEESIGHQVSLLREFAKQRDIGDIPDDYIYEDTGVSATSVSIWARPAMKQLLDAAEKGLFQVVLFKGISRFSRSTEEALSVLGRLKAKGLRVISYEEGYDSQKDDTNLIFTIHSAVAEYEAEKLGVRVRLGNKEKARRGMWVGSPPFGYDLVDRKLEVNEEEAEIVRMIFQMYTKEGKGSFKISQYLNEHRLLKKSGRLWSRKTVTDVLKNEVYTGKIVYNKLKQSRVPDYDSNEQGKKKWVAVRNEKDEWIIAEGSHDPIVDERTFKRAQELLSERRTRRDAPNAKHPLSGILKCGRCGANHHVLSTARRKKNYRYYICRTYATYGRDYCSQQNTNADAIEDYVVGRLGEQLRRVYNQGEANALVDEKEEDKTKMKKEITAINKKIEKINIDTADLYFSRESMTDEQYSYLSKRLKDEMIRLTSRKDELEYLLTQSNDSEKKKDEAMKYISQFFEMDKEDKEQLRMLLHYFIDEIKVDGTDIEIFYRFAL